MFGCQENGSEHRSVCMLCLVGKKVKENNRKGVLAFELVFCGENGRSECLCYVWLARKWKRMRENKLGIEFFLFYFFRKVDLDIFLI